ncbi:MAG: S41 family peptidase [Candidatus Eremiobacteraeota bacterium]|nr:S41 family peptidase [Candidatus Eremiobacteraeota bacterium]
MKPHKSSNISTRLYPIVIFIFILLAGMFLHTIPAFAQQSREMLLYSYIMRVRELIKSSYYKPVSDEVLVRGAIDRMRKVLPSIKTPSKYDWRILENYYLGYSQKHPSLAGKLGEAAIDGMVDSLRDPYSVLLTPSKRKILEGGDGSGIGLELGYKKGKVVVIAPIVGSPAKKTGLKSGDRIVAINGRSVRKKSLYETSMLISGKRGQKISISVIRNGRKHTFHPRFAPLEIDPIKYSLLSKNIGYIRIGLFSGKILREFQYALNVMKKKKVRGLIIDLRNNPGGDFMEALRIAARFVPDGVLVWVIKKAGRPMPKKSVSGEKFNAPVVVLINEGSASASEVLAAALSENNRAVLMGRKTFGKGVVQTVYNLTGGARLCLTTEKYLTPKKRNIQDVGLMPKIVIKSAGQNVDPTKDGFVIKAWKYLDERILFRKKKYYQKL